MSAAISAILALIEELLPVVTSASSASLITSILNALTAMLPFIIQEVEALITPVKNIIAALSANPATTAAQLATLQSLDASVDASFEAATADTDAGV